MGSNLWYLKAEILGDDFDMKVVILAGGLGTRLREETEVRPKPLVEIGGLPILWHIMKIYSHYGLNDFVICLGYKGYLIKEFFANHSLHMSDVTFDMSNGSIEVHQNKVEPWRVTLIDTGEKTMTGGRVRRIAPHLGNDDTFCLTYGDGLADVDIPKLIDFHKSHGRIATLTAARLPGRFGAMLIDKSQVLSFEEKPIGDRAYVNGGFFVLSRKAIDYIDDNSTEWERKSLVQLSKEGQLMAFHHDGFFHPMDTIRDRQYLEDTWNSGAAPWKVWK